MTNRCVPLALVAVLAGCSSVNEQTVARVAVPLPEQFPQELSLELVADPRVVSVGKVGAVTFSLHNPTERATRIPSDFFGHFNLRLEDRTGVLPLGFLSGTAPSERVLAAGGTETVTSHIHTSEKHWQPHHNGSVPLGFRLVSPGEYRCELVFGDEVLARLPVEIR